jgi:2-polyprenyl-6-methoxyphenol hydroxylase-like FAD-dependent oxidoreductase
VVGKINHPREGHFRDGDAPHAMSPVGGVGINLAIQDAVAASDGATEDYRACVE